MALINDRLLPLADARVGVLDLAFLRGCGLFETLRTFAGHPHAFADHYRRMAAGAARFGFAPPVAADDLRRLVVAAITASGHPEARVNLVLSPGDLLDGTFEAAQPRLVALIRALVVPPATAYEHGQRVVLHDGARPLPEIKSTNYLCGWPALAAAQTAGAAEALYRQGDGTVTEGVTSNLHLVRGNTVVSPASDCLPGLTRARLAPLARAAGLAWREDPVTSDDLATADEVWLSSSIRLLMPVVAVDGRVVGDGRPGPWARRLGPELAAACRAEALADASADT